MIWSLGGSGFGFSSDALLVRPLTAIAWEAFLIFGSAFPPMDTPFALDLSACLSPSLIVSLSLVSIIFAAFIFDVQLADFRAEYVLWIA